MSYIHDTLREGETVCQLPQRHWILYAPYLVVMIIGCGVILARPADGNLLARLPYLLPGGFLLLWGLGRLLLGLEKALFSEYAITSKRVTVKYGMLRRRTASVPIRKIESTNVDQSFLGRMLGYGTVSINGTGGESAVFEEVCDPVTARNSVMDLVDAYHEEE